MREMIKMIVVLSLICGISGLSLAALKIATAPRIEEQVLTYVQAPAIEQVLAEHDNNPIKDRKSFQIEGNKVTVFPAIRQGSLVGLAFETFGQGYGGDIGVMVGFSPDSGNLTGVGITTLKETPGVGSKVTKHGFTSQFNDMAPQKAKLKADGGEINAVAGATISSTGTVVAVQKAVKIFDELRPELTTAWK
ncbi:RnfABCDGE type electron transport complex subunit G [Pseudodesulfovibrio senegalensis]|uniref:Ion-translocating oxidoreductase complex subunit G n=1 Tax=Pseudodesulfovibrio senegalensis TaxID=1721087 RepID=A0A6N6N038_9BACT|nr:RnfABCDGE type electron transport complex subunit G [Pseudodesulfovibrio senegalensis]KAB1440295.1 RnfABCDGE type electron transport complex subunit G [Pseudodesulfovibrio senegalensis]